jgi:3-dehydroquinate dehydratase type I
MTKKAIPIKVKKLDPALYDIQRAEAQNPDLVELRLDYMPKGALDEKVIDILLECCDLPVIGTIRDKDESGPDPEAGFKGLEGQTEEEIERYRASLFKHLIGRGVAYLDIEASKYDAVRSYMLDEGETKINKGNTRLILSHHDFEKTPEHLIEMCAAFKYNIHEADIIKIAVKANSEEDYKRIVHLIEQTGIPLIAIGMGELGAKTRLHPGNFITYACIDEEQATAVGQYTVEQMRKLLGENGAKDS